MKKLAPLGIMLGFVLVASAPALAQSSFTVKQYSAGTNPRALAVVDVNGDGRTDLVVANSTSQNVSVLLGNEDGTFGLAIDSPAGDHPNSVAAGDFDGDGDIDLALVNSFVVGLRADLSVLFGDGTGRFSEPVRYLIGFPSAVAVADVNRDGHLDLLVTNNGPTGLLVMLGDGTGQFGAPATFAAGLTPVSLAAGDLNGDTFVDVAVANRQFDQVLVLFGDGTGRFSEPTPLATGNGPFSVAMVDINADNNLDLVTADAGAETVSLLLGDGLGGFTGPSFPSAGIRPLAVAAADMNGDVALDLIVTGLDAAVVLHGNGEGLFSEPEVFAGLAGVAVVAADVDNDDDTDIAIADYNGNKLSLLLRQQLPFFVISGGTCSASARSATIDLALSDNDTPVEKLSVSASSNNQQLVPNGNLVPGGAGANRTLTVTAIGGNAGAATITIVVNDGAVTWRMEVNLQTGGNGNDMLRGTSNADIPFGENGDDTLDGRGGSDLLCGGRGNDTLIGGPGPTYFSGGQGIDTLVDFRPREGDTKDSSTP